MDESLTHVEGIFGNNWVNLQLNLSFRPVVCDTLLGGITIGYDIFCYVRKDVLYDGLAIYLDSDAEVQKLLQGFAQILDRKSVV